MTRRRAAVQLSLTRPSKRVRVHRLTERQRELLSVLRWTTAGSEADALGPLLGYAFPREACDRLVARGLAVKVGAGVYRARKVGERRT